MDKNLRITMALTSMVFLLTTFSCTVRQMNDEEAMELYEKAEKKFSKNVNTPPNNIYAKPTPIPSPTTKRVKSLNEAQLDILLNWALKELTKANQPYCWRNSYGRGVGVPISACPDGQEKDAGLCYKPCKKNYKGVGPVCWQSCPSGFRDDGAYCFKPRAYGRGVGYGVRWPLEWNDKNARKRCERDHGKGKCEKSGLIWYQKCKTGYRAIGCCICSPKCPSGMTDIGISCQKKSYGRGVGKPMQCKKGQDYDAGLCYKQCKKNYRGVGPVCWQRCPDTQPFSCGAGCAASEGQCAGQTLSQVLAPVELAMNVAGAMTTGGISNATVSSAKASARIAARASKKTGKAIAKETVKKSVKAMANEMVGRIRAKLNKKLLKKYSREIAEEVCWNAAESLAVAALANDFDTKEFLISIDPTGIADVVDVFDNPKCGFDEDPPNL